MYSIPCRHRFTATRTWQPSKGRSKWYAVFVLTSPDATESGNRQFTSFAVNLKPFVFLVFIHNRACGAVVVGVRKRKPRVAVILEQLFEFADIVPAHTVFQNTGKNKTLRLFGTVSSCYRF